MLVKLILKLVSTIYVHGTVSICISGNEVTAISTSPNKEQAARDIGADKLVSLLTSLLGLDYLSFYKRTSSDLKVRPMMQFRRTEWGERSTDELLCIESICSFLELYIMLPVCKWCKKLVLLCLLTPRAWRPGPTLWTSSSTRWPPTTRSSPTSRFWWFLFRCTAFMCMYEMTTRQNDFDIRT